MYGLPPADLLVLRIFNNTDKIIKDISFNYEGSNMNDVVISSLKPKQDKQTGISTIHMKNHTNIMMYNKFNDEVFSYVIREDAANSFQTKKIITPLRININNVKGNGELELTIVATE